MASRTIDRPPIAILTDFGYRDHYAGVMKGVIASIAPGAQVIDIAHGIPPQSVVAGAIALRESWRYFPSRTIFVAVVDPGVGTARAPIAIETKAGARFIGPDNGLLSLAATDAGIRRTVKLSSLRHRLQNVSATFHGRDVFAPAAAWLWRDTSLDSLGPSVRSIVQLALPSTAMSARQLLGEVIYEDAFGNLVTNIDRSTVRRFKASFRAKSLSVRIGSGAAMPIIEAYGDARIGAPLALFGSMELLEIAVRDSNAARRFKAGRGTAVIVTPRK
ncbi:MAG TPA: SAM-dependent chlorinase/fluorinase [Candidatus Binataceae bacterium]|nr:SAM-dependent chlorinase/fluorinase [Candidatus Binataceae bacterium]